MKTQAHFLIKHGSRTAKRYWLNIRQTSKGDVYRRNRFEFNPL